MNVSMVSVSRRAGPPHFGHATFTNSGTSSRGDFPRPVNFTFEGSKGETLYQRYEFWLVNSALKDGNLILPPPILDEIDVEIARLTSILEEHEFDPGARKIIVRRRHHIPDSPAAERLLRYEATLERAFERTLAQLERMQRIRKGQPVPRRLEVGLSV